MRRSLSLLLVALAGCRTPAAPLRIVVPEPALPTSSAALPDEPDPVARVEREPFSLAWSAQGKPFSRAIALSPAGAVAVLGARSLSLYDDRGRALASRDVCSTLFGDVAFVSDAVIAVVCEREVTLYDVPSLAAAGVRSLAAEARVVAHAPGVMAIASDRGVVVLETETWTERHRLVEDRQVTALALSRDGKRVALGLDSGEVALHVLGGGARRVAIQRNNPIAALDFAPDGQALFVAAGAMSAVYPFDDAQRAVRRFRGIAGVKDAAWAVGAGSEEIASVGRDGLLLLDVVDGTVGSVGGVAGGEAPHSIAAGPDRLCAASHDGMVFCYRRGTGQPVGAIASAGSVEQVRMIGTASHHEGARLHATAQPGMPLPAVGTAVTVVRYTEVVIGEHKSARWIEVADGKVERLEGDVVHVRLSHQGLLPKNTGGSIPEDTEPLADDTPIKLVWQR